MFCLGIGNDASTALCEGIARVGNGAAQFVVDGESLTGKMARLLKASRSPQLLNIRLELPESKEVPKGEKEKVDDGFELLEDEEKEDVKKDEAPPAASLGSLSLFDESEDPLATDKEPKPFAPPTLVDLPPPPPVQQAPHTIQNLFPGTRFHGYLILTPADLLPKSIFLRAMLASGQKLELEIPVTTSALATNSPIHTLAARKLIQDLEDGRHGLKDEGGEDQLARVVKASIVRLGKIYSLASKHTSFVAVDESEVDAKRKQTARKIAPPPPPPMATPFFAPARGFGAPPGGAPKMRMMSAAAPMIGGGSRGGGMFGGVGRMFGSSAPDTGIRAMSTTGGPSPAPRGGAPQMTMFGSAAPYSAIPPPPPAPAADAIPPSALASIARGYEMPGATSSYGAPPPNASPSVHFRQTLSDDADNSNLSTSDRIDRLARLQGFDGSFDPSAVPLCTLSEPLALGTILNHLARIRIAPLARFSALDDPTRDKVLATAVVLAFWKKSLEKQREEWEGMADKGQEFGAEKIGADEFEQLMGRVSGFV